MTHPASPDAGKPPEIAALTALRFVAAAIIVFHHLPGVLWLEPGYFGSFNTGNPVSFFFVLSGFVLQFSYRNRLQLIGAGNFIILRFFRLWPAHLAVLALAGLLLTAPGFRNQLAHLTSLEVAQIVFLLHSYTPDKDVFWGLNSPSWSISTELFFYMMFPLLVPVMDRRPRTLVAVVAVVSAIYLWFATHYVFDPDVKAMGFGLGGAFPLIRLPEFVLGMFLAEFATGPSGRSAVAWIDRTTTGGKGQQAGGERTKFIWTIIEISSLILLVVLNRQLSVLAKSIRASAGDVVSSWASATWEAPAFAIVIWIFYQQRGHLSELFSTRLMVWLGTISFALYLVHQPLIHYWKRVVNPLFADLPLSLPLSAAAFAATLLALSAMIHAFVEKPGIAFSKYITRRRSPRAS